MVLVFTDGVDAPGNGSNNNVSLKDAMKRAQQEKVMVYAIGLAGRSPEGLAKIAGETGGGYFELTNTADLASTFKRVADELHQQHVLGFTPARLDGKMHELEVKLTRPDLVARARKSDLAKPERTR